MKIAIDFFLVPKQYLKPNADTEVQPFIDQIASSEFHKAVKLISEKYNVNYLTARSKLIKICQAQSTFSLYGICCHVLEGKGWAASQFAVDDD